MAKQINTRILLKYDTLANWQASAFNGTDATKYLKAGELAIVTLGPDVETNHPENASKQHPLLFKVGDGTHKFDDLAWASALAADVYDWAKAAKAPDEIDTRYAFDIVDGKLQVTETKYIDEVAQTPVVKSYDFVTPTELETALASYYTKTEIDNKLDAIDDKFENLDESITTVTGGTGISVTDAGTGNDHAYTVALDVDGAKTALGLQSAAYVTVESLNATAKGYADDVEAKLPTSADYGVLSVTGKEAIKVTEGQNPEVSLALDASGNVVLSQSATGLKATVDLSAYRLIADDEDTTYGLAYDSDKKVIKLVEGGTDLEIPASDFVADGMLQSVVADKENNTLTFTWNTDGGATVTTVNLTDIADIYTGKNGTTINVAVSNTNEISAEVNAKSITAAHLADELVTAINKDDDTTYEFAATQTALQFTVTPKGGQAETITLVAPEVNTGVMSVTEGSDNGTIAVDGTNVAVHGLTDAAFATAGDGITIADGKIAVADVLGHVHTIGSGNNEFDLIGDHRVDITAGQYVAISAGNEVLSIGQYNSKDGVYIGENKVRTMADKVTSDDFSDEVFIFNCGTASTVL